MRELRTICILDEATRPDAEMGDVLERALRAFIEDINETVTCTPTYITSTLVEFKAILDRLDQVFAAWLVRTSRAPESVAAIIVREIERPRVMLDAAAEHLLAHGYPAWQAEETAKLIAKAFADPTSTPRALFFGLVSQWVQQLLPVATRISKDPTDLHCADILPLVAILEGMQRAPQTIAKLSLPLERHADEPAATAESTTAIGDIVGQHIVMEHIGKIVATAAMNRSRKAQGLPTIPMSFHCVFAGSPGTGKTTIARLFARELKEAGLLRKGHLVEVTRSDLVAGYMGQSALKTKAKLEEARGGVLFIDEAYSLVGKKDDSYGHEVIDTVLKFMEDNRTDLIVVVAGYSTQMRDFLRSNPGLESRFSNWIEFQDYTDGELLEIFDGLCRRYQVAVSPEARTSALSLITQARRGSAFANARTVRQVFESAVQQSAVRAVRVHRSPEIQELFASDFADAVDEKSVAPMTSRERLMSLTGLSGVKQQIANLAAWIEVTRKRRGGISLPEANLHMVFSGSPGTGKTSVARLFGELLKEQGLLASGHVIEVDRSSLVGEWLGQTGPKTTEAFRSAFGGVLFIDEAYSLSTKDDQGRDPYGAEAVNTLLKLMEDHRDKVVVIAAGYASEMELWLASNPGLRSRFSRTIVFEDFADEELLQIFHQLALADEFTVAEDVLSALRQFLPQLRRRAGFANARSVRNLFESIQQYQAVRVHANGLHARHDLSEIALADVKQAMGEIR